MKTREAKELTSGFIFLEAPRSHDGAPWVADVFGEAVYRIDMKGNKETAMDGLGPHPNSINFLPDGTPSISSNARQINKLIDGKLELYADLSDHATGPLNDFTVDEKGRIYCGNFGYDLFAGEDIKLTSIHRIDPDGSIHVAATDRKFPNGTAITNGGKTLIVSETWCGKITAFDRDPESGTLSNRRVFADLPGRNPDGLCADTDGGVWTPSFNTGEVMRIVEGETTDCIVFNGSAIACWVGGPEGHTLFCTTYDGTIEEQAQMIPLSKIFTVNVDVPGQAWH